MKISTKKRSKTPLIITLAILVIIAGVIIYYFAVLARSPSDTSKTTSPTAPTAQEAADQARVDSKNKQDFLDNQTKEDKDSAPPGGDTASSLELSAKTDNDAVIISTNLSSIPSGTCTLTITGGSTPVVKTAPVIYATEYSSCAGFSIKKSEVNATKWTLKLDVTYPAGSQTKTIAFTP